MTGKNTENTEKRPAKEFEYSDDTGLGGNHFVVGWALPINLPYLPKAKDDSLGIFFICGKKEYLIFSPYSCPLYV